MFFNFIILPHLDPPFFCVLLHHRCTEFYLNNLRFANFIEGVLLMKEKNKEPLFNPSGFIDTEAAARFLDLQKNTLEIWRYRGEGPVFHKFGRAVRYSMENLRAYADKSCRVSTSEL